MGSWGAAVGPALSQPPSLGPETPSGVQGAAKHSIYMADGGWGIKSSGQAKGGLKLPESPPKPFHPSFPHNEIL